jgi:DinB family protein
MLTMELHELLIDLFDRIPEHIHEAIDGLDAEALITPPEPGANTIGWEVWHLTRVQDDHIADILGDKQVWVTGNWAGRFGVAADPGNTGYGHSWKDVMSIRPESAAALIEYYEAVAERTRQLLERTTPKDLDRIVDKAWDPPVTLGVRLISIADDDIQHAAHASYTRGILDRR